jgi:hypothetical protein
MIRYDRSSEVDAINAAAFIKYVHATNDKQQQQQQQRRSKANASADANESNGHADDRVRSSKIIAAQKELLSETKGWSTMPSSTRFQTMSLKFADGDKVVTGRVVFLLACSPAEALASYWLSSSNATLKKTFRENGSLPYEVFDDNDEDYADDSRGRKNVKLRDASSSHCQGQMIQASSDCCSTAPALQS